MSSASSANSVAVFSKASSSKIDYPLRSSGLINPSSVGFVQRICEYDKLAHETFWRMLDGIGRDRGVRPRIVGIYGCANFSPAEPSLSHLTVAPTAWSLPTVTRTVAPDANIDSLVDTYAASGQITNAVMGRLASYKRSTTALSRRLCRVALASFSASGGPSAAAGSECDIPYVWGAVYNAATLHRTFDGGRRHIIPNRRIRVFGRSLNQAYCRFGCSIGKVD